MPSKPQPPSPAVDEDVATHETTIVGAPDSDYAPTDQD